MNSQLQTPALALMLAITVGCSNIIHQPFSVDNTPPKSLSLDARQRTILVTDRGGKDGNRHIVCAEPSPDVASALAATFGANLSTGVESLGLSASKAESVAQLGRCTQTIQLLRDALYRACESLMNGAISDIDYQRIIVAMDEFMITLLAIDGLLQQTPPTPITLHTTAHSSVSQGAAGGDEANTSTLEPGGDASITTSAEAGSNVPNIAVNVQPVRQQTAEQVKTILESYLCFQLNLKKTFLVHDAWENGKDADGLVSLWETAGIQSAVAGEGSP